MIKTAYLPEMSEYKMSEHIWIAVDQPTRIIRRTIVFTSNCVANWKFRVNFFFTYFFNKYIQCFFINNQNPRGMS